MRLDDLRQLFLQLEDGALGPCIAEFDVRQTCN